MQSDCLYDRQPFIRARPCTGPALQHLIGEEKERTVGGAVLSLFLLVTKRLYGKKWEWSIGQIKTCRKKQHVKIDDKKEMQDLICGKVAVGGNYNSPRDIQTLPTVYHSDCYLTFQTAHLFYRKTFRKRYAICERLIDYT